MSTVLVLQTTAAASNECDLAVFCFFLLCLPYFDEVCLVCLLGGYELVQA